MSNLNIIKLGYLFFNNLIITYEHQSLKDTIFGAYLDLVRLTKGYYSSVGLGPYMDKR